MSRQAELHPDPATALWMAGDRSNAMALAFSKERATMYAIGRAIAGEDAGADVAQEAFLAVWQNGDRFDPTRAPLGSYLRVVARGRALDHARATAARQRRDVLDAARQDDVLLDSLQQIITQDLSARVAHALRRLRTSEREAIVLAFYDQVTYREIARRIGVPEGTVKSRIRTGLRRLRAELSRCPVID